MGMDNTTITRTECGHLVAFGSAALMQRLYARLTISRGDHYVMGTGAGALRFADAMHSCSVCA